MICNNILEAIGNTPMVRINRLCPNQNVNIFAKIEGFNPTGSIKDRIALAMVNQAEKEGKLYPGKTIIEPTSGNTGIGLPIAGNDKGYPVEILKSAARSSAPTAARSFSPRPKKAPTEPYAWLTRW